MPGDSGAIRAGRAFVSLFVDRKDLTKGLQAAAGQVQKFGQSVAAAGREAFALGAVLSAPFVLAAKIFADTGSALTEMSERTGASVESLSALSYAADQSGASLEDVETALKKAQVAITKAGSGAPQAVAALKSLHLTAAGLKGQSPEQQFEAIAKGLQGIDDPAQRAAAAVGIFGKQGTKLLPMLGHMDELKAKAQALGIVMSTEDATAAKALGDAWKTLVAVGKGLAVQVGAALAPALTQAATYLAEGAAAVIRFVKENRELVITVAAVAAGIAGIGAVLITAGTLITALGTGIAVVAAIASFILSPFGILVTLIGAIGAAALIANTDFQSFGDVLDWIKQAGATAFDGLVSGVATVVAVVMHMKDLWAQLPDIIGDAMTLAGGWIKHLWDNLVDFGAWFGAAFVNTIGTISNNIVQIFLNLAKIVDTIMTGLVAKALYPQKFNLDKYLKSKDFGAMLGQGLGFGNLEGPKFREREYTAEEKAAADDLRKIWDPVGKDAAGIAARIKDGLLSPFSRPGVNPSLGMQAAAQHMTSAGSFSAFAGAYLARGGPVDEIKGHTARIADGVDKLVDHAEEDGGEEFE